MATHSRNASLGSIGGGGGVKSDLREFTAKIIGIEPNPLASTSVCPFFHSVHGKKTFWNLERNIVEKRKEMLSEYLGQRGPPQHRH